MAIENSQTADADEVMNSIGHNFKNTAQILYNAEYIGWDSLIDGAGVPSLKDTFVDVYDSDSMVGSYVNYDATVDMYYGPVADLASGVFTTLDEFNDDVVADIWVSGGTVGTVTEANNEYLLFRTAATATGVMSLTLTGSTTDDYSNYMRVRGLSATISGASTNNATIGIGGAVVWSKNGVAVTNPGPFTVDVVRVGLHAWGREKNDATGSWGAWTHAAATTSGPEEIGFTYNYAGENASSAGEWKIDWIKYYPFSSVPEAVLESLATTTSIGSATNAISTFNIQGAIPTTSLSADDGANYEAIEDSKILRFTDIGSSIKLKHVWTDYTDTFSASEHAVTYNYY